MQAYEYPELVSGDEIVVQYYMALPPGIPARKFYLNLNVFSQGEEILTKQIFNETVEFIEESKIVDFELLGLYAIFYAIIFAICYSVYNYAVAQGWVKKSKPVKKTRTCFAILFCSRASIFSHNNVSHLQMSNLIEKNG